MLLMVTGVLELIFLSNQFVRYLSDTASGQIAFNSLFHNACLGELIRPLKDNLRTVSLGQPLVTPSRAYLARRREFIPSR